MVSKLFVKISVFISYFCIVNCSVRQPGLAVTGSAYEVGYEVGKTYSSEIANILTYFYCTRVSSWANNEGASDFAAYKTLLNEASLSQYKDEMQGMADGASVTYDQILMLNLEAEVRAFYQDGPVSFGTPQNVTTHWHSGDYLFRSSSSDFYARTMDMDTTLRSYLFLLEASYYDGSTLLESIYTLSIPGFLPGLIGGANINEGFFIFFNDVYQTEPTSNSAGDRIPLSVIKRAAFKLSAPSSASDLLTIEDTILAGSTGVGPVTGYSFNAFSLASGTLYMAEIFIENDGSVVGATSTTLSDVLVAFHCNKFQVFNTSERMFPKRSSYRMTKMSRYQFNAKPMDKSEIITFLGSTYGTVGIYVPETNDDGTGIIILIENSLSETRQDFEFFTNGPSLTTPDTRQILRLS